MELNRTHGTAAVESMDIKVRAPKVNHKRWPHATFETILSVRGTPVTAGPPRERKTVEGQEIKSREFPHEECRNKSGGDKRQNFPEDYKISMKRAANIRER